MPNTKIVATLGPATDSDDLVRQLLEGGVDVFRLNASHGTQAEHGQRIERVRRLAAELGKSPGIMLDLQGPKIRLGTFDGGACVLKKGDVFTITTEPVQGSAEKASISYPKFAEEVAPGDRVLLADGSVELTVLDTDGTAVRCRVRTSGIVGDRKGVNLPGIQISTPSLTRKDMSDLRFGLGAGIDLVALSFVRKRDDMLRLRLFLEEQDAALPLIAKIEKPEAWESFDQVLEESDGVMVARGDLGVEMALEKVPSIQKSIIERARVRGKFIITATQMLESMVHTPFPTRAEVSDVANAIYDGTDAVMLSAETSTGSYPAEAVRMMARVAEEAEASIRARGFQPLDCNFNATQTPPEIVADVATRAANIARPAAIVALTSSGYTARLVARYRPPVPIFVFTPSESVVRQLSVVYGVQPILVTKLESSDEVLAGLDQLLQERCLLKPNDQVIILAGLPMGRMGPTNIMKLHRVGELR